MDWPGRKQGCWEFSRGIGDYFVTGTNWHSTICPSVGGGEEWLSSISSPVKCNQFFHWEGDDFSASNAKVTGSCVLYGDIPLVNRAACTRVTPLALPEWFTILGIVVALFGPSNSSWVGVWTGDRDGKSRSPVEQGVELAAHTILQKCAVILSSINSHVCGSLYRSSLGTRLWKRVWRQVPAWDCHGTQCLPWWIWPGANGLRSESLCYKHCAVICCCGCLMPYCTLPTDPGFALGNT